MARLREQRNIPNPRTPTTSSGARQPTNAAAGGKPGGTGSVVGGAAAGKGQTVGSTTLAGSDLPSSYVNAALRHVGRFFQVPPEQRGEQTCVARFTILRSGEITNVQITKSSGDPERDRLAKKALEDAKRFSPLPDSFRRDSFTGEITFAFKQ
jgi:TonB family protein